ncbi:glycosyl transferase [Bacteroidia bacterium]|nr:glycosyl transferase [Bacteroidia bacterium]
MAEIEKLTPDYLFESSWEVCNKVGGIYTVLSTRAKTLQSLFKDRIIFIGPDLNPGEENPEFTENKTLLKEWKKQATEQEKLRIRVGRWNVPGKPVVVLVDFRPQYNAKNSVYYQMWENYRIDSTVGYGDYDESCVFAYTVGLVIDSFYKFFQLQDRKVIAHINEWTLGMTLLYLHAKIPNIATIFTTHATSIGRSICGNNKPLYCDLVHYDGDQMARELNMTGKHSLEKKAALYADCFTTVSEITAKESEQLLNKPPDVITPNGFEANFVPKGKSFEDKRETARKAFIRVAEQLTGTQISDDAFLLATAGRYEYKNKGLDVFVEAIHRIKQAQPAREIVAFILVPAWIKGVRKDLQERLAQKTPAKTPLADPYITHELVEPQADKICDYLRYLNFTNQDNNRVKIIFVPSYLKGEDGIFNLPYYDLLVGLDMTVFPSYYEPWGYTPLESIAFHIPTITTNLAGFGLWARTEGAGRLSPGVKVIDRTDFNYFEVAEEIKNTILEYASNYSSAQLLNAKKAAYELSEKASWKHFIQYYLEAYDIALNKKIK